MNKIKKTTILKKSFILAGIVSILLTIFKLSISSVYLLSIGSFLVAIGILFGLLEDDLDDKKSIKIILLSMIIFSISALVVY